MYCPRLDHFVRFNANGTVGKCGHMVGAPGFSSHEDMQRSEWLAHVRDQMSNNEWPTECSRCEQTEQHTGQSIRLHSLDRHRILIRAKPDYLILGGVLDNICNSACQSCNANLSTKIGSLESKIYPMINNGGLLDRVPRDRIVEIDLNGGEPSASPAYQRLLQDLPLSTVILRVNTNASRMLPNIISILSRKIKVIVTISLDGVDRVHEYLRWPITWQKFTDIIKQYKDLSSRFPNLELQTWTTLHALNLADFDNIKNFSANHGLKHDWAYIEQPLALNVKFKNRFTVPHQGLRPDLIATDRDNQLELDTFMREQDKLRGINWKDYL